MRFVDSILSRGHGHVHLPSVQTRGYRVTRARILPVGITTQCLLRHPGAEFLGVAPRGQVVRLVGTTVEDRGVGPSNAYLGE
jgi:hypothetical protein